MTTLDIVRDSITDNILIRSVHFSDNQSTTHCSLVELPDFVAFLPKTEQKQFWKLLENISQAASRSMVGIE